MPDPPPECTPGWTKRCYEARGTHCRCKCGGANHGIQHRLTFEQPPPTPSEPAPEGPTT